MAATRLSVYMSHKSWGVVVEVFGFSPRSEAPSIQIYTFSNKLANRNPASNDASLEAYENDIKNNKNNELNFVYPINNENWMDDEDPEYIKSGAKVELRDVLVTMPELEKYSLYGIKLEESQPLVYELCRYIASEYRDKVLCTEVERRCNLGSSIELLLQLDEWCHPDIVEGELPSQSEVFQQIADVIVSKDVAKYKPTLEPNTHWVNWPEGGSL